jgi:hypothetical protein
LGEHPTNTNPRRQNWNYKGFYQTSKSTMTAERETFLKEHRGTKGVFFDYRFEGKKYMTHKSLISVSGIPIRLTGERLFHIYQGHPELQGCEDWIRETISNPEKVFEGDSGALMAVRKYEKTPVSENKFLVVVYKEQGNDGFVITAYFTRKLPKWRKVVWQR